MAFTMRSLCPSWQYLRPNQFAAALDTDRGRASSPVIVRLVSYCTWLEMEFLPAKGPCVPQCRFLRHVQVYLHTVIQIRWYVTIGHVPDDRSNVVKRVRLTRKTR